MLLSKRNSNIHHLKANYWDHLWIGRVWTYSSLHWTIQLTGWILGKPAALDRLVVGQQLFCPQRHRFHQLYNTILHISLCRCNPFQQELSKKIKSNLQFKSIKNLFEYPEILNIIHMSIFSCPYKIGVADLTLIKCLPKSSRNWITKLCRILV